MRTTHYAGLTTFLSLVLMAAGCAGTPAPAEPTADVEAQGPVVEQLQAPMKITSEYYSGGSMMQIMTVQSLPVLDGEENTTREQSSNQTIQTLQNEGKVITEEISVDNTADRVGEYMTATLQDGKEETLLTLKPDGDSAIVVDKQTQKTKEEANLQEDLYSKLQSILSLKDLTLYNDSTLWQYDTVYDKTNKMSTLTIEARDLDGVQALLEETEDPMITQMFDKKSFKSAKLERFFLDLTTTSDGVIVRSDLGITVSLTGYEEGTGEGTYRRQMSLDYPSSNSMTGLMDAFNNKDLQSGDLVSLQ